MVHGFSFLSEQRLKTSKDFDNLKRGSRKASSRNLVVYYKSTLSAKKVSRLGLSVSKRFGNACFRNKIKRIIREYYRTSSLTKTGQDMLFVLKKKFGDNSENLSHDLREELVYLEKRICNQG